MLKVGITGGIGSGKTIICKLLELQNVPVFYADQQAKAVLQSDSQVIEQIKAQFGTDIYAKDGMLNRSRLASIVFNDEEHLKKLNSLVHPAVFQAFDKWLALQQAPYVVKEAALLFESGSYQNCDLTVLVKSPRALRISRIIKRDAITEAEVLKRMNKQWSDEEKEKLSHFIINNDEQQLLIPRVLKLHADFLNRSSQGK